MTLEMLTSKTRELVTLLLDDVEKAKTREEHIRIVARANEASHILFALEEMATDEDIPGTESAA